MEICGAHFKLHLDCDLFAYFHSHYQHFFPSLTDRPAFVRQAANLWRVKMAIWRHLVTRSGEARSPVQVIDTLPLPVCTYTRSAARPMLQNTGRLWSLCRQTTLVCDEL